MSEESVRRKQQQHLDRVRLANRGWGTYDPETCLHNRCQECFGTGVKVNGSPCIHMISCRCAKCSPTCWLGLSITPRL